MTHTSSRRSKDEPIHLLEPLTGPRIVEYRDEFRNSISREWINDVSGRYGVVLKPVIATAKIHQRFVPEPESFLGLEIVERRALGPTIPNTLKVGDYILCDHAGFIHVFRKQYVERRYLVIDYDSRKWPIPMIV